MTASGASTRAAPTEGAQAVRRAMGILRVVAASQERGARLVDIVRATELSRPTVHRILQVLAEEGVIEQDPATRRYIAGPEMALMGLARTRRLPVLAVAEPYLRQLCEAVGDTVFLSVRRGLDSVGIERKTGSHPIQVLSIQVGARRPLGVGVSGVAIMACLDEREVQRIVQANEPRLKLLEIDPQRLLASVATARRVGHAYAAQGVVPGTSAVAVPVADAQGQALAAISIAAMAPRLTRERLRMVLPLMHEAARQISRRWGEIEQGRRGTRARA